MLPTTTPPMRTSIAGDHERGVVEDRADLVAPVLVARARREHDEGDAREQDGGDGEHALHGPGGTTEVSQSRVPLTSRHGALPSDGACEAPPGQRATAVGLADTPGTRWAGGTDVSRFVGLVVGEGVEVRAGCGRSGRWRRSWRRSGRSRGTSRRGPASTGGRTTSTGVPLLQRLDRRREGRASPPSRARASCSAGRVKSLSAPGWRRSVASSLDRRRAPRAAAGAASAQERRQVLRRRLGRGDQLVEVVERRAQVHERRVAAAQRLRQLVERLGERPRSRPRSRRALVFVFVTRSVRSSRRSPSVVTTCEVSRTKRLERRLVGGELRRRACAWTTATARSTWRPRWPRSPCPRTGSPKPWMTSCSALARLRVERVEELVEVDDRRRLVARDAASSWSSALLSAPGERAT